MRCKRCIFPQNEQRQMLRLSIIMLRRPVIKVMLRNLPLVVDACESAYPSPEKTADLHKSLGDILLKQAIFMLALESYNETLNVIKQILSQS